ncbi:hypothetical protein [Micromonospora sp. NPDC051296]|uniref:hypothetical protein n=1 Tax=Micromonospora sp. NPDC051296 TaxID=3155046 RepID=UPI00344206DC
MSTGEFSGVDHDLLADYLGGALDGTPEAAEVARLVAEDPAWAQAHALLAPAVAGVRAELAEWAGPAPEMPSAVADRILAALDAADPAETSSADDPEATGDPDAVPIGAKPAAVPAQPLGGPRRPSRTIRPGQERSAPTRPGRRRRRWARVAGPVALAAVAVVGLGALQLARPNQGVDSTAGTALSDQGASPVVPHAYDSRESEERATAAEPERSWTMAQGPFEIVSPPQRSGTDYTPQALAKARPAPTMEQFSSPAGPGAAMEDGGRLAGPGDLARLGDQAALSACLAEISAEHGEEPLVFNVIDYARFQGFPALVIRFTDVSGAYWAWVSGPECGVPGSGSDTRYRTRVG